MGIAGMLGLDDLPNHLLAKILQEGDLDGADLARLEMSCYTFRAAGGLQPYRFNSMTENAALLYCQSDPVFARLPPALQSQLVTRCGGNRKLVMRFLQATRQAATGVRTAGGQIQVVAGKYITFLIVEGILFGCGSNQYGVLGQGPLVLDCVGPIEIKVAAGCRVKQISGTHNHVAFVSEMGEVYTYGDNSSGCCGHGDVEGPLHKPTLVESLSGIPCKQVSTGLSFTAALTSEGGVYTWGSGSHGQLGHGDTTELSRPAQVDGLSVIGAVIQIATGASYTLSLMDNGDLYSFGYGANHCLGNDDASSELRPSRVVLNEMPFFTSVAAGDEHCAAIDSVGQVYTWGKGYCGALGHGDEADVSKPTLVHGLKNVLAVQVFASRRKTFVVADNGQMFGFGWNSFGSLGNEDLPEKVLKPDDVFYDELDQETERKDADLVGQVSAGFYHTVCILRDGQLLSFGDNAKGQAGFCSEFLETLSG